MAAKKSLMIVFGLGGIVLLAGAALVGTIVYSVVRHLEVRTVSTELAEQEYNRLRDRFAGQAPLLEIDRDDPESTRVHRSSERISSKEITELHIFAWNPRDGKMAYLDLPMWLLRLRPRSESVHWNWGGKELDLDKIQVTLEDLERHGPGLILDFEGHGGERVLLWCE